MKSLLALKGSILFLSLIACYALAQLTIKELSNGETCIKLANFPLCYLLLICTLMMLAAQFIKADFNKMLFWFGVMIPWSVTLITSIMQINNLEPCAHTRFGIPTCYLGLLLFSLIILLNRLKKNSFPKDGVSLFRHDI